MRGELYQASAACATKCHTYFVAGCGRFEILDVGRPRPGTFPATAVDFPVASGLSRTSTVRLELIGKLGAWVAITGRLPWPAWALGRAVALWVAGFDLFHSLV